MPEFRERSPTVHAEQFLPDKENWFLLWRIQRDDDGPYIIIPRSSGDMRVDVGDWVVRHRDGQFSGYTSSAFKARYHEVISFPDQDYHLSEREQMEKIWGPLPTEEVTC